MTVEHLLVIRGPPVLSAALDMAHVVADPWQRTFQVYVRFPQRRRMWIPKLAFPMAEVCESSLCAVPWFSRSQRMEGSHVRVVLAQETNIVYHYYMVATAWQLPIRRWNLDETPADQPRSCHGPLSFR